MAHAFGSVQQEMNHLAEAGPGDRVFDLRPVTRALPYHKASIVGSTLKIRALKFFVP